MIIEFLSKQNEEIVQVELILNYLKELEGNDPIILSKHESEIFRDRRIDIKVDHRIVRIRLREQFKNNPALMIRVYNEENFLLEEIDAVISDYAIEKSRGVLINYIKFDLEENIVEKQCVYQENCLKRNRERVIETSADEVKEIVDNWFNEYSIDDRKALLEEHNSSLEEVIEYLRKKISFSHIIKKIEEKRDIKVAFQNTQEQPSILFKKFEEQ